MAKPYRTHGFDRRKRVERQSNLASSTIPKLRVLEAAIAMGNRAYVAVAFENW